jgi:dipeptidase E
VRRLLLASSGIGALPQLADVAGMRFVFVPTAAGPDADSKPWVQKDRRQLERLGCESSTLDLAITEQADVASALAGAAGVFVTGGNSYLLLWHARRSGFAEVVVPLVESGALIYVGTSAGALLAGPDLAAAASLDNRRAVPELESSLALGLVSFTVLPHDEDPESREQHDAIVAEHPGLEFLRLADDRAAAVRGDDVLVVDSPLVA